MAKHIVYLKTADYLVLRLVTFMVKKAHITINLLPEASDASVFQIEEKIRNEAAIPWCKNIETVSVEDNDESYRRLQKQGIPSNVARNLLDLYTE
jgi:hypothetical protein